MLVLVAGSGWLTPMEANGIIELPIVANLTTPDEAVGVASLELLTKTIATVIGGW